MKPNEALAKVISDAFNGYSDWSMKYWSKQKLPPLGIWEYVAVKAREHIAKEA